MNHMEQFSFGRVYPAAYSAARDGAETCALRAECVLRCTDADPALHVSAHFLRTLRQEVARLSNPVRHISSAPDPQLTVVPELFVGGQLHHTSKEATEERVRVPGIPVNSAVTGEVHFAFPESRVLHPLRDETDRLAGILMRRQDGLLGTVEVEVSRLAAKVFKVAAEIRNLTAVMPEELDDPEIILMRTFTAAHLVLQATDAEFVSVLAPPAGYESHAAACRNSGLWPVLLGDRDTVLASPIVLEDYPQIGPEVNGDFGDDPELEVPALHLPELAEAEEFSEAPVAG